MVDFVNSHNGGKTNRPLHAVSQPPQPAGPTAGRYVSACGTLVRNVTTVEWLPEGYAAAMLRRCDDCSTAVRSARFADQGRSS